MFPGWAKFVISPSCKNPVTFNLINPSKSGFQTKFNKTFHNFYYFDSFTMQEDNNLHTHLYPQVAGPDPYQDQSRQGQYVGPAQFQGSSSQGTLIDITMKINTQLYCYMWLVCFELIISILSLIITIITAIQVNEARHVADTILVLDVLLTLPMIGGCIASIQANSSLNKSKQYAAFVLFTVSTAASVVLSVMAGIRPHWMPVSIVALGIQSFIGLFLICGSYSLYKLMSSRDNIVSRLITRDLNL